MSCVRIERLTNGYVIRVRDPKIEKANAKRETSGKIVTPWRDPEREFVFTGIKQVLAWLDANIDKALPVDDYDTAFDMAAAEAAEEDDENE